MAETNTFPMIYRTKSNVSAMKETVCAQQQHLQRLYIELDREREAASTAASEAMDMILRLQGEKALVEMEASHYKRMAEEKIGHAEASLEAYEELMYEKEMEIASLEFQVQAYKDKLMSLGCDLSSSEFELPETMLLNRSDQRDGENGGQCSSVRRIHSMPPIQFKNSQRVAAARKGKRSASPVLDLIPVLIEESSDREVAPPSLDLTRKTVDFARDNGAQDSYLNQIKMLNQQGRVSSDGTEGEKDANLVGRRGRSCSKFSLASTKITCDQTDEVSHGKSTHGGERVADNSPSSLNVHDVFEVPQTRKKHEVNEHGVKRPEKLNCNAENRLMKPDFMSEEMVESLPVKHGADKKKGMLRVLAEVKTPWPHMTTIIGQKKERKGVDYNYEAELRKLNQRIEMLERERISARQEITHEGNSEEQLRLLNEIQTQLNLIQSEIRGWKTKKATPKDDVSLTSLQEAMLHFWL
ncbi:hypothetical protein VNO77_21869 [Canavalia gladiata]|uniref:GTD-binding domain-containing protein n=1 Tax=Canavalia gladiata TaxID=3824 RepID=A0AAN9L4T2_CANGL